MKNLKLTTSQVSEIKEAALKHYQNDAPDSRNQDLFVASCYIKSTLDFLERNGIIKYTVENKAFPYEPVDE